MTNKKLFSHRANTVLLTLLALVALISTTCSNPANSGNNNGATVPENGNEQPPDTQLSTVTDVTVSPATAIVVAGQTLQFSAVVAGTNDPAQTVIWTVEGGGSETGICTTGLLSVAESETALMLTVRATSTVDTSKSGTATVTTSVPVNWEVHDLTTWADAHYGITNGSDGKIHIITVSGNVIIPPTALITNTFENAATFGTVTNITIIIQGGGIISVSNNGNLLRIGDGQTVILKDITLQGRDNDVSLVDVWGGTLHMVGVAKVTGNTAHSANFDISAGGVRVTGGTFIMQDEATVSGNIISTSGANREARGGGVRLSSGSFIMKDNARVEDNAASINFSGNSAYGGGVYVSGGTFIMEGGTISNNTVSGGSYGNAHGGGIYININGEFILHNGTISENTVIGNTSAWGGGVFGNFTMHDGIISDNTVQAINTGSSGVVEVRGGGVNGNLTMHGGTISGNTVIAGRTWGNNSDVNALGGGVYGLFTMHGGTISGNTVSASNDVNPSRAFANGGGIYARWEFAKTGGTIYSNYAADGLRNIAIGGRGHAIFHVVLGGGDNWRNAFTGPNDNTGRLDFWLNETDIIYDIVQDNWPPTSLTFTFSDDPGNIQAPDITFCNNVSSGGATLSGSGTVRTLSPVSIGGDGIITASIFPVYMVHTGFTDVYLIPPAPTDVAVNPSASTVTLGWDPVPFTAGYRVYRGASATTAFDFIETTSGTRFVDIRRDRTTSYFYRITSFNVAGESVIPTQISATTLTDNTEMVIAVSTSSIVIEWPRDRSDEFWMNLHNRAIESINNFLPISIFPTHRSTFRIYRNDSFLREIEIPTRLTTIIGWPPFTLVQDSNLLNHYLVDNSGLSPNTNYNYRVDIQFYLDIGLIGIPTMQTETIMTGSAKTL
ncbi:MAG: hypothetical protein LBU70_10805 [Chitinispirillales bacterium]|jgi:hypothetical protein|nr:hypothetical protein [Chitinispirillales bacterium]